MKANEQEILKEAIEYFDESLSNSSCNDCEIADTPENRELIKEYRRYSYGGDDENILQFSRGKLYTDDGLWVYLLKKNLGLLKNR